MPTYDYLCQECEFKFEEFQSMAAEPLHVCPRCGGNVRRLISAGGGIIFKGSGFYETDYKRRHSSEPSPSAETKKTAAAKETSKTPETAKAENKST